MLSPCIPDCSCIRSAVGKSKSPPCPPFPKGGKQKLSTRGASPPLKRGLRGICFCLPGFALAYRGFALGLHSQGVNAPTPLTDSAISSQHADYRADQALSKLMQSRRGASPAFASPLWKRGAGGICSCLRRFALGLHSHGINAPTPRTDPAISSQCTAAARRLLFEKRCGNQYGKRQEFRSSASRADARRRRPWPDAGNPDACRSG